MLSNDGTDFIAEAALVSNGREHSYSCRTPFRNDDSIIEKRFAKRCIKIAVFRAMRKAYPDAHLPWGSLTGIRPTRLLRELQHSCGPAEAKSMMLNDFDVTPQKFALAERIVSVQEPIFASVRKTMLMFISAFRSAAHAACTALLLHGSARQRRTCSPILPH